MATYLTRLARLTRTPTHSTTITRRASSFRTGPAPPRLPPSEQAEFERLQRTANTQEGFNATSSPDFTSQTATTTTTTTTTTTQQTTPSATAAAEAIGTDNAAAAAPPPLPLRKGAPPEFEGDVNPRTGEVGGPKNEPLRWGAAGDYSYNGRVTDF
ncbi:putative fmp21-like protein [Rosellinia necatrix]|uniref:Succinate dehydrogenase assembly factor 4, mitochondrial n=1 Tax=Rosellinia necatrix TaxID=77044 RepID=A0A1S8AAZ7_ROSNE|nr:putative fmp21-like protein [Rosellinia necatrix]